jgi:hypothetical protein
LNGLVFRSRVFRSLALNGLDSHSHSQADHAITRGSMWVGGLACYHG